MFFHLTPYCIMPRQIQHRLRFGDGKVGSQAPPPCRLERELVGMNIAAQAWHQLTGAPNGWPHEEQYLTFDRTGDGRFSFCHR